MMIRRGFLSRLLASLAALLTHPSAVTPAPAPEFRMPPGKMARRRMVMLFKGTAMTDQQAIDVALREAKRSVGRIQTVNQGDDVPPLRIIPLQVLPELTQVDRALAFSFSNNEVLTRVIVAAEAWELGDAPPANGCL